ncbi:MFS general substrate transporter [Aspergillus campestris IBT 28561]|uniref:Autophagy-related protein n=1 Tax=Aspergillus campestris (strain IBT 28561) TaxID=1392248 RepID=A0A2I1CZ50_ASPC2|nr:MFS general substrate transporter [Aspergillus campestris IBT 28561]PKY02909.1 MFS general substrate transporter [Aspergillus campestris IBT 28561]
MPTSQMPGISSRASQHPGDDTRPTSKKELAGWYSYGWAAEVFTVCAMGSFLPITLEQMARDRGVLLSDKRTPCSTTWHGSGTSAMDRDTLTSVSRTSQCVVDVLGFEINTASFAMYTFSLSVFVQAILIVSMSGAADHGNHRKMLLVTFALIGSIATMLFLSVTPSVYLLASLFAIVANTCFGASFVLLNSFLPLLVRHHPSLSEENDNEVAPSSSAGSDTHGANNSRHIGSDETALLLQPDRVDHGASVGATAQPTSMRTSRELSLSTRISSYGIGIGYIGSVILQVICILVVIKTNQTTFSLRLALFLIGLWWFSFTIPAALWLRPRPGPPIPLSGDGKQSYSWLKYIIYAWKSLGRTALRARRLKDILLFLAAWFLLSDGIATVSGTAVLFAKTQLQMQPATLGLINVITMVAGVLGAFSWSYVSRVFGLRASQTIIACIMLFELIPLYGLLGFIPAVKDLGYLGLQQPWEMFPLGVVYGLVMGGLSSYCRSFFGELIPPGYEAAFYALYAITDKGSSIFGPAIVGIITDRYGDIRPAFLFLAVLIGLPLPLMFLVDVERGKRDALGLSADLDGRQETGAPGYGTISHVPPDSDRVDAAVMED